MPDETNGRPLFLASRPTKNTFTIIVRASTTTQTMANSRARIERSSRTIGLGDKRSRKKRQQAANQGGRGGDGAVSGGPLHEGADDPEIFFSAGVVGHVEFTLYYKVKSVATVFLRQGVNRIHVGLLTADDPGGFAAAEATAPRIRG